MASPTQVSSDIERMTGLMDHIMSLSKQIGGFNDGPQLREQIQVDVKNIMNASKVVKDSLSQLQGSPGTGECEARFEQLRARMQQDLPNVISKLRQNTEAPPSSGGLQGSRANYTEPILDQMQLDGETEQLETLAQQVNQILRVMREVHEIFGQTLEELQKQRHLLGHIEGATSEAVSNMESGNEQLEQAHESQKKSTKCICAVAIIVVVVAVGVAMLILYQVVWKDSGSRPAPIPSASPAPQYY
jgi:hypothetical protein